MIRYSLSSGRISGVTEVHLILLLLLLLLPNRSERDPRLYLPFGTCSPERVKFGRNEFSVDVQNARVLGQR